MNKLRLRFIGDPVLRMRAEPVREINDDVRSLLAKMEDIMRSEMGAGLAAPQVGILLRMLIFVEIKKGGTGGLYKMLNPKIVASSDSTVAIEEGCLSVQGENGPVFVNVLRPESVVVEWTDENGALMKKEFGGYAARAVQHEIDHLDGILFVDRLSSVKREMVMRKVKKRKL